MNNSLLRELVCKLNALVIIKFQICSWCTINDQFASESPAYFCQTCFKMLHYDKDGQKLCKFEAYPYFDENTTLLETPFNT